LALPAHSVGAHAVAHVCDVLACMNLSKSVGIVMSSLGFRLFATSFSRLARIAYAYFLSLGAIGPVGVSAHRHLPDGSTRRAPSRSQLTGGCFSPRRARSSCSTNLMRDGPFARPLPSAERQKTDVSICG